MAAEAGQEAGATTLTGSVACRDIASSAFGDMRVPTIGNTSVEEAQGSIRLGKASFSGLQNSTSKARMRMGAGAQALWVTGFTRPHTLASDAMKPTGSAKVAAGKIGSLQHATSACLKFQYVSAANLHCAH